MRACLAIAVGLAVGGVAPAGAAPHRRPPRIDGPLWTELPVAAHAATSVPAPTFVALARRLGPAVVNVTTLQPGDGHDPGSRARGLGTGFIIHPAGLVLTNQHVIGNATQIRVRLADEREFVGHLVGADERTDIALVKIDAASPLPVAPLGDSDKVEIGEWVVAIGNPFGLDHTVTVGIVSAKGRRDVRPGGLTNGFYDYIQTDASINVGNSGGPLIDARGEVIGINTAINSHGQGIAFAVPINMAKVIVPELWASGYAPRSWLGVYAQSVTPTLERAFALHDASGALVAELAPGSPAARAGVRIGDLVLELDGHPIRRADDLDWIVATASAGKTVPLVIVRKGVRQKLDVTLARDPDDNEPPPSPDEPEPKPSALGVIVSEINRGLAREMGTPGLRGLAVVSVEDGSPAFDAGVERGDVVLRVGDAPVASSHEFATAVATVKAGEMVRLLVRRGAPPDAHDLWIAFEKR